MKTLRITALAIIKTINHLLQNAQDQSLALRFGALGPVHPGHSATLVKPQSNVPGGSAVLSAWVKHNLRESALIAEWLAPLLDPWRVLTADCSHVGSPDCSHVGRVAHM